MSRTYEEITPRLKAFIERQPVFFTATAPSGDGGHVNVSPKGMSGTLQVLDPLRVAYLDWGGSGIEGTAHMRQNGRICVMFCSFGREPRILRLHGVGEPIFRDDERYEAMQAKFPEIDRKAVRAVVDVRVQRVADSCGFGVPYMEYVGERDMLLEHNARRTPKQIAERRIETNLDSVDGLPGLRDHLPTVDAGG